jgi:alpha-mannosidase
MGRPMFISSTVMEDGPVTRVTRQRARWMNSEVVLDIAQFAGLDLVELRFVIDWQEKEQILKLEIPTSLAHPRVFAKVPGAVIERRTNGEEEPYQDWAALEGTIASEQYTLAIINNSTYSYDCMDGTFRTILIRSAPFARHNPNKVPNNDNNAWQDQGRQERTFWLIAGKGTCAGLALDRRAEEVQTPAQHVFDSAHPGSLPWQQSFLEVMPGNIQVLALKRAEGKEDCTAIRLQERSGVSTEASLKSAPLSLDTKLTLRPWELKTLLVKPKTGRKTELSEVSLLET